MSVFKGCGVAIITPFNENGINENELEKMVNYQIENGTSAIIVCGTTGEASTMSLEEKIKALKIVKKAAKNRVKVIAGSGTNCTEKSIHLSKVMEDNGADGLLVITPYYNKCTNEGLYLHYKKINDSVNIPIIMYNVPQRTGVDMDAGIITKIYNNNKNIVAIKEASGNFDKLLKIVSASNIDVYSGNDSQIVPCMSLGAKGVISVVANAIPKEISEMTKYALSGDFINARMLQIKYSNLISLMFKEVNPVPIKELMNMIGFDAGLPRLPLTKLDVINKVLIEEELNKLKISKI